MARGALPRRTVLRGIGASLALAEEIGRLPDVVLATTHMFMCSDPAQVLVEDKIRELNLSRIVVAACVPQGL